VARKGERRGVYSVLVGILEGKSHLGDTGIDGDNIMMNLQEVRCGRMDLIELSQNRDGCWALVNAVMNLQAP